MPQVIVCVRIVLLGDGQSALLSFCVELGAPSALLIVLMSLALLNMIESALKYTASVINDDGYV